MLRQAFFKRLRSILCSLSSKPKTPSATPSTPKTSAPRSSHSASRHSAPSSASPKSRTPVRPLSPQARATSSAHSTRPSAPASTKNPTPWLTLKSRLSSSLASARCERSRVSPPSEPAPLKAKIQGQLTIARIFVRVVCAIFRHVVRFCLEAGAMSGGFIIFWIAFFFRSCYRLWWA